MKRIICMALVGIFLFSLTGCGSNKTIDGVEYSRYGIFNESSKKNDDIQYEIIVGNVVWSILLIETVIVPIYFIGFDLYEPIGKKKDFVKGKV